MKKRIGIITIHGIQNYGSALQAYALQHYLQTTGGCEAEIIDYVFPNEYHLRGEQKASMKERAVGLAVKMASRCFPGLGLSQTKFRQFQKAFLRLSRKRYRSVESLMKNPPVYDVYVTGSDQVWNSKAVKGDPVFFCGFAPLGAKKISFAASISQDDVKEETWREYKRHLSGYSAVGLREATAAEQIRQWGLPERMPIALNCDPTLLLSSTDYDTIAATAKVDLPKKYIFVYMLDYAFNPHPAIDAVVERISRQMQMPVVLLGSQNIQLPEGSRYVAHTGPAEFVRIMQQASYVVTSSFHGLMFSLVYRKPFTVVVPTAEDHDTRITDVLQIMGLSERAVARDAAQPTCAMEWPYTEEVEARISGFIQSSKEYLRENLR